jgi:hypothetical protein
VSKLALDPINIQYLSSAPVLPTLNAGDMYFDTTLNALQVYNGSAWIKVNSKIYPTNSSSVGLTVVGLSSQTGDLQQWQTSSGAVFAKIDGQYGTLRSYSGLDLINTITGSATITAKVNYPNTIPIIIQGAASQTADLQQWQNNSGTVLAKIDSAGNLSATNFSTTVTNLDGGVSDSIAPYAGGKASSTSTQTINGGSA